ncbi:MAG: PKD domain-containing protein [Bacteroidota bacterium]
MNHWQNIKALYLVVLLSVGLFTCGFSQEEKIDVYEVKNENGSIDFFATNTHTHSFAVDVSFDELINYKSSIVLPLKCVIEANTEKKYLFTITPTLTSRVKYSYNCIFSSSIQSAENNNSTIPDFTNCTEEKRTSLCITLSEDRSDELDSSLFDYEWVLGDGNIKKGSKIKHCYTDYGEYIVKLNVFDKFTNENLYNVATEKVVVKKEDGLFFDIPGTALVNEKVPITNVIADIDAFDNNTIYWNFSDGTKAMGIKENHIFENEGDYIVKLGVISFSGTDKQCIYKNIKITK